MSASRNTAAVMDLAQVSDRRALFAGLQVALLELVDAHLIRSGASLDEALERIHRALTVGAELGSPEELAAREQRAESPLADIRRVAHLPPGTE